jgi:ABC-type glycerol-3-phosphate transport system permease component
MLKPTRWQNLLLDVLTLGLTFVLLFPIIWLFFASFKPAADLVGDPLQVLPTTFTLDGYRDIWKSIGFQAAFRNSLLVAGATAIIVTSIGLMAACSLSRFSYRYRGTFSGGILAMQMLPGIVIVVPLILILQRLGLTNSLPGLIVAYMLLGLPVSVWMLKGYMDDIPPELDQAALIDGANYFQVLGLIIVPLMAPAIVAVGAFAFMLCWGEYLFALSLITSTDTKTLPLALQAAVGQFQINWGMLTAGGVIISLPPAILFIFFQRWLVGGLTSGGVKG